MRLNQPNTLMQGKDKMFLDVSEDDVAFESKIKLTADFLTLNAFAEEVEIGVLCIHQILSTLPHFFLSWIDPSP